MSCSVDHRCGSDPELLWLWRTPAAIALGPLAWEFPYATGVALKSKKTKQRDKQTSSLKATGEFGSFVQEPLFSLPGPAVNLVLLPTLTFWFVWLHCASGHKHGFDNSGSEIEQRENKTKESSHGSELGLKSSNSTVGTAVMTLWRSLGNGRGWTL